MSVFLDLTILFRNSVSMFFYQTVFLHIPMSMFLALLYLTHFCEYAPVSIVLVLI